MSRKTVLANTMKGLNQRSGQIAFQHLNDETPLFQSFYCKDYFMDIIYSDINDVSFSVYGMKVSPNSLKNKETNNFLMFETLNNRLPSEEKISLVLSRLQKEFKPFKYEKVDVVFLGKNREGYLITYDTKLWQYPYYFSFILEVLRNCHEYNGETWKEYFNNHACGDFFNLKYAPGFHERIEIFDLNELKEQEYPAQEAALRNPCSNIHNAGAFYAKIKE